MSTEFEGKKIGILSNLLVTLYFVHVLRLDVLRYGLEIYFNNYRLCYDNLINSKQLANHASFQ